MGGASLQTLQEHRITCILTNTPPKTPALSRGPGWGVKSRGGGCRISPPGVATSGVGEARLGDDVPSACGTTAPSLLRSADGPTAIPAWATPTDPATPTLPTPRPPRSATAPTAAARLLTDDLADHSKGPA